MINFIDKATIGSTKKTSEGYLIATSKVARTGVQDYLASELGDVAITSGFDPNARVKVYRHADEVFHADSLQSLTRIPVTIGHPKELVTSDNWASLSVGDLGDAFKQDGDWIVVNPMLKDAKGVTAAETTHRELSAGYTAEIIPARDGLDADFEMVNIRFNHLALVPKGRAGSQARIGDNSSPNNWGISPINLEDENMVDLKTVIFGDKSVSVEAKDAETVAAILKDHKTALDAKDAEIGVLDAKVKAAEAKILSDADIEAMLAKKAKAKADKAAVVAKVGDKALTWTDAQIDIALAMIGDTSVADALKDGVKKTQVGDYDFAAFYAKKGAK